MRERRQGQATQERAGRRKKPPPPLVGGGRREGRVYVKLSAGRTPPPSRLPQGEGVSL